MHKDGSPLDEFNFQAHDVWIGHSVQHRESAMILHGMKRIKHDRPRQCQTGILTKEPLRPRNSAFRSAAPEGFNGSCRLHPEARFEGSSAYPAAAAENSTATPRKGREHFADSFSISPTLQHDFAAFNRVYNKGSARESEQN